MTVTVTPTVELGNTPPRVRLNITASAGETSTTVTRLDPDGDTVPVRTEDGGPLPISAGVGLLYDYEMPYGLSVTYSSLESPGTVSAQVTAAESQIWLVHVGVPALSVPVELNADSFAEEEWGAEQGVYWPLGGEFPIVHTDGQRKAPASSVVVRTHTLDELEAVRTLLSDMGTLLLNVPVSLGLGVDACYVAVGPVRNRRLVNIGGDPNRVIPLPYQVVDRPVGGSQAQRTLVDLLAYPTLGSLQAQYPTLLDLLAGP